MAFVDGSLAEFRNAMIIRDGVFHWPVKIKHLQFVVLTETVLS